ncbi:MAG: MATE family efflux transporter [Armatimonadetes bacterium]|nr:MATE family efflux transporter [Armatimonadota bacterium]
MDNPVNSTRRRNHASQIITSGHIWSAVWYLAWPTAINTLILTGYSIINRMFLGRLPEGVAPALAAVGIGGTTLMIQFALMIGLAVGASALVARFLGAENYDDANDATRQAMIISILGGVVSAVPLIAFARPIVSFVGAKGPAVPLAADYLAITAYFSVPMFVYVVIADVLRSAGDVRRMLYVGAVVIVFNIVFDWLLIFGVGPFPALGVRGAAIATGISRVAGLFLIVWVLRRSVLSQSLDHLRPHFAWFRRIMNIGWPAMIMNLLWTTAFAGFIKVLAYLPDATAAQAALTVGITIESLAFMPGVAYSIAATPLVGQNLGAGKPERAVHSAWVAAGQAAAIMSSVAVIFLLIPEKLAVLFTDKETVVPLIVSYLIINAFSEPFQALGMVLRGALQGAGDTRKPMLITLLTNWIIRLPLAWLLANTLGYGATGAWVAMSATTILSGLLVAAWFVRGSWREIQV